MRLLVELANCQTGYICLFFIFVEFFAVVAKNIVGKDHGEYQPIIGLLGLLLATGFASILFDMRFTTMPFDHFGGLLGGLISLTFAIIMALYACFVLIGMLYMSRRWHVINKYNTVEAVLFFSAAFSIMYIIWHLINYSIMPTTALQELLFVFVPFTCFISMSISKFVNRIITANTI